MIKNNKLKLVIAILLLLAIITSVASCGQNANIEKSFDVVLNEEYVPQEKLADNIAEIPELENYNFFEAKGEFMTFTKVEDDASISKAVFSTRNKKVVFVGKSTASVSLDVNLVSSVPAFTITSTRLESSNAASDIEKLCVMYDAMGNCVGQSEWEELTPLAFADTVIFDNMAYSINPQNGALTKIADVIELVYADGCDDWTEEYYCTYGDTVNVYTKSFEHIYSWGAPEDANIVSHNMLNNGNVIIQYTQLLDADAKKYDVIQMNEDTGENEKFKLTSVLINPKKQKEKKIKLKYIISQVTTYAELMRASENNGMYSEHVENIAYVFPIIDGKIDFLDTSEDVITMSNNGKIQKSLKIVEEQRAALPIPLKNNKYLLSTFYGFAIVDIDGNVLNKINNTVIAPAGNNIVIEDKIYTFEMEEVYTLDETSEILAYIGKSIIVKKGNDTEYSILSIRGAEIEELYNYSIANSILIDFDFFENSACYFRCSDMTSEYICFDAEHNVIKGLDRRLKKVASDFATGITVYCAEYNNSVKYYTIY